MPSGRTHDSITLWGLPLVAAVTFERTRSASLTLLVSGGYLFSGLMFGPDLDTHSCQYKRWGLLRWIWLPYRRSMRHRSLLSHGPILGTVVRVLYLLGCLSMGLGAIVLGSAIAHVALGEGEQWLAFTQQYSSQSLAWLGRSLLQHFPVWLALGIGLELGALSHTTSDWIGSFYKRQMKRYRRKPSKPNKPAPPSKPPQATQPAQPTPIPPKPIANSPKPPPAVELPPLPRSTPPRDSNWPPIK